MWRKSWWMSSAHSQTFPSLYLRHSSFSNLSLASPTSRLILQHFRHFTYVTAHSPTLPSIYLRHSSFSNLPLLQLRHSSFYKPLSRISYVTGSSLTSPGEPPMIQIVLYINSCSHIIIRQILFIWFFFLLCLHPPCSGNSFSLNLPRRCWRVLILCFHFKEVFHTLT